MPRLASRLWTYQRERFPLVAHGPLVAAFSGGVACASAALRGAEGPGWGPVVVAVVVALGAFFQLRVADEWKDAERDAEAQPERPVPRGLVTLRELWGVAAVVAAIQLALTLWLSPRLLWALAAVWGFGALMTVEFGARDWLRGKPLAVLVSHGFIVPFIDWFAVSADVLGNGAAYPEGVGWLVGVSLFGGMTVEIGRKVWAPAAERPGVESYSGTWGRARATALWAAALVASLGCGLVVLRYAGAWPLAPWLVGAAVLALGLGVGALRSQKATAGTWVEAAAGLWTLGLYLTIGPLALWAA